MKFLSSLVLLLFFVVNAWAGSSLNFDGTDDQIDFGIHGPVTGSSARSICLWVKATSAASGATLVEWGDYEAGGNGERWGFRIDYSNGEVLRTEVTGGFEYATTDVADGTWHWVCSVLTGTNITDVVHYVDGSDDGTGASSAFAVNTVNDCYMRMGARFNDNTGAPDCSGQSDDYTGNMAYIHIYSKALAAWEIQQLMYCPFSITDSLSHCFTGTDTSSLVNLCGSGDGTFVNNVSSNADGPPISYCGGQINM